MLKHKHNLGGVEARHVFRQAARHVESREELAARNVVEHEVQLGARLEGAVHVHNERVSHLGGIGEGEGGVGKSNGRSGGENTNQVIARVQLEVSMTGEYGNVV